MRISLDFSELTREVRELGELVPEIRTIRDKFLKSAGELIEQRALLHHRFESRTGNLEEAIEVNVVDDTVEVSVNDLTAPYATFIHGGTGLWGPGRRMYAILPRERQTLYFDDHAAKKVMHPGIQPDPFLYDAIDAVEEQLFRSFSDDFDDLGEGGP